MKSDQRTWMTPQRILTIYTAVFSTFIAWASLRTTLSPGPHGLPIQLLAMVELPGQFFS